MEGSTGQWEGRLQSHSSFSLFITVMQRIDAMQVYMISASGAPVASGTEEGRQETAWAIVKRCHRHCGQLQSAKSLRSPQHGASVTRFDKNLLHRAQDRSLQTLTSYLHELPFHVIKRVALVTSSLHPNLILPVWMPGSGRSLQSHGATSRWRTQVLCVGYKVSS